MSFTHIFSLTVLVEHVFKFLLGLNDTYAHVHCQILPMDPLPNVGKCYAILNQGEKQQLLHLPSFNMADTIAMTANSSSPIMYDGEHSQGNRPSQARPKCEHCGGAWINRIATGRPPPAVISQFNRWPFRPPLHVN